MFGHVLVMLLTCLDVFWQKIYLSQFLYLDILSHVFDRTKYTLHSTKYSVHSKGLQGFRCAILEFGQFRRWRVREMGCSREQEFTRLGVQEMGSSRVKLQGSNPGSLLRSKSARRDRRCEAASERLVSVICPLLLRKYTSPTKNETIEKLTKPIIVKTLTLKHRKWLDPKLNMNPNACHIRNDANAACWSSTLNASPIRAKTTQIDGLTTQVTMFCTLKLTCRGHLPHSVSNGPHSRK